MPILSTAEQAQFQRDGFLVLPGFVAQRSCDRLRDRAAELVEAFDPNEVRSVFTTREQARRTDAYFLGSGDQIRFFFEEDAFDERGALRRAKALALNKIGHALHDLDPVFDRFSRTSDLEELASDVGLDGALLMQSMYIFKQPFIGGEVRCHQDATYLHADGMLGLWFALEDAHVGNGCLWALPGGHRAGLRARFVRAGEAARLDVLDATPWDEQGLVPLEAPKGSLILLDGLVPHLSRANRSPRSRHAYTLHLVPPGRPWAQTNWLQRGPDAPARGFGS